MSYELWLLKIGDDYARSIRAICEVSELQRDEVMRINTMKGKIREYSEQHRALESHEQLKGSGVLTWIRQRWAQSWFGFEPQAGFQQRINAVLWLGQEVEVWSGSLRHRYVLDGWDDAVDVHVERFDREVEAKIWTQNKVKALRAESVSVVDSMGALVRALRPRSPELEASVRAAPEDAARVYCDWLMERSDPRGALMARPYLDPKFDGWSREELKRLLGPLWEYSPWLEIEWSGGLFRKVKLWKLAADPEVLGWLLESPMALGLQEIRIPLELCGALSEVSDDRIPPGVFLESGDVSGPQERARVAALLSRLKSLKMMVVRGLNVPLTFPALRRLEISAFGSFGLWGLAKAELPVLERLKVNCASSSFGEGERPNALDSRWEPVLKRKFPALKQLELNHLGFWPTDFWDSPLLHSVRKVVLRDQTERPEICQALLSRPETLREQEVALARSLVPGGMITELQGLGAVILERS